MNNVIRLQCCVTVNSRQRRLFKRRLVTAEIKTIFKETLLLTSSLLQIGSIFCENFDFRSPIPLMRFSLGTSSKIELDTNDSSMASMQSVTVESNVPNTVRQF